MIQRKCEVDYISKYKMKISLAISSSRRSECGQQLSCPYPFPAHSAFLSRATLVFATNGIDKAISLSAGSDLVVKMNLNLTIACSTYNFIDANYSYVVVKL